MNIIEFRFFGFYIMIMNDDNDSVKWIMLS